MELFIKVAPIVLLVFIGLMVIGALAASIHDRFFTHIPRARRALRKAPRVPIGEARDGQVIKVAGELRCVGEPLEAPLTGRRCAFYHVIVERKIHTPGTKTYHWETIVDETDHLPRIVVDDGRSAALVDLADPEVVTKVEEHGTPFLESAGESAKRYLARHYLTSEDSWKTLRFREFALEQGKQVAVLGLCRREPDPDPQAGGGHGGGYRDLQTPTRVRVGAPEGKLLISDEPSTL